ncbi:3-phytase [Aquiflexum balticum DSM 16537]|uniref:3-phytase n=1 Tax=Aquiflexum balticum DSM 16537 TaxID=758820 RepID=A0A1W2H8R0_9BACT|nr:phytase [Aquiflexum balticum]SMD45265.1 3-phytase [Aquiflexum balticum DSM 16537]
MKNKILQSVFGLLVVFSSCGTKDTGQQTQSSLPKIEPLYITEKVIHDTDDPAIWINKADPEKSLIIGTDKDKDGALYVFDLKGKIMDSLVVRGLQRPNNVDVSYGLSFGGEEIDFAVTGERLTSKLRFFKLPGMLEIQEGGIEVYLGELQPDYRDLMGVAVYYDKDNGKHYVIAGRKNGPTDGTYLWQYLIKTDQGQLELELVRKFGQYSGNKEIEAIAVDNELGYIYYSDEGVGVRKYYADPEKGNDELALFATEGFTLDHEGISIYKHEDGTGYILVSDQEANFFHVFPREGSSENPHLHTLIAKLPMSTVSSDGSEVINFNINPEFPKGLFVAMSDDKTFQIYDWRDLENYIMKSK